MNSVQYQHTDRQKKTICRRPSKPIQSFIFSCLVLSCLRSFSFHVCSRCRCRRCTPRISQVHDRPAGEHELVFAAALFFSFFFFHFSFLNLLGKQRRNTILSYSRSRSSSSTSSISISLNESTTIINLINRLFFFFLNVTCNFVTYYYYYSRCPFNNLNNKARSLPHNPTPLFSALLIVYYLIRLSLSLSVLSFRESSTSHHITKF